jgi:hypothetical protein
MKMGGRDSELPLLWDWSADFGMKKRGGVIELLLKLVFPLHP